MLNAILSSFDARLLLRTLTPRVKRHTTGPSHRYPAAFCLAVCFTLCFLSQPALADGRAFPPDDCSTTSPFMAFTGVDGSNTYCNSGQDIMFNAIPSCGADQIVAFDGHVFYCKDGGDLNVPTCAPSQVLTYTGTEFACVAQDGTEQPGIPDCAPGQVLTKQAGQFACVVSAPAGAPTGTTIGDDVVGTIVLASCRTTCTSTIQGSQLYRFGSYAGGSFLHPNVSFTMSATPIAICGSGVPLPCTVGPATPHTGVWKLRGGFTNEYSCPDAGDPGSCTYDAYGLYQKVSN